MGCLKTIRQLLLKCDFFPHKQMLTYRNEDYYSTVTGGVLSILLIALILVFVTDEFIIVMQKAHINTSTEFTHQLDPSQTQTSLSPEGGFMFAAYINGLNFTSKQQIFDIVLLQQQATALEATVVSNTIAMELCTIEHFAFNNQLQKQFEELDMNEWLCPPLNYQMKLKGKLSSTISKRLEMVVRRCNSDNNSNCVGDTNVTDLQGDLGSFKLVVVTISPEVNVSSTQSNVVFHTQTFNRLDFTTSFAVRGTLELADYTVETDQSLLLVEDISRVSGVYAPNPMKYDVLPNSGTNYARILFEQSSTSVFYSRYYTRIDDFLAYVGGLISSAIAVMFILSFYNEICYYISIGSKLFLYDEHNRIRSSAFNLWKFVAFGLCKIGRLFGCCMTGEMGVYVQAEEEVKRQLDVVLLMRRLNYLQRCLALLLPQHQLELMHSYHKPTLAASKNRRQKHHLNYQLTKQIVDQDKYRHKAQLKDIENQIHQNNSGRKIPLTVYMQGRTREDDEMSRSSVQTVPSQMLKDLKEKARVLEKQAKTGNQVSRNVIEGMHEIHYNQLIRQDNNRNHDNRELQTINNNWQKESIHSRCGAPINRPVLPSNPTLNQQHFPFRYPQNYHSGHLHHHRL